MVHIQSLFDIKANRLPNALAMRQEGKRRDPVSANIAEIIPPNGCKINDSLNTLPISILK